jgi:hypothetical protein
MPFATTNPRIVRSGITSATAPAAMITDIKRSLAINGPSSWRTAIQ